MLSSKASYYEQVYSGGDIQVQIRNQLWSPRVGVDLIHPMSIKIDCYVVYTSVMRRVRNLNKGAVLEMINYVIKFSLPRIYVAGF